MSSPLQIPVLSPPRLRGSSELLSSSNTVCADFLRLLDVACRDRAEGAATAAAACGVEGGSSEEKPTVVGGGEEEEPGSEAVPSRLWLLLKVQLLPLILLRLPMELRMTVARLRCRLEPCRSSAVWRSVLVLIRFCRSDEKAPAWVAHN